MYNYETIIAAGRKVLAYALASEKAAVAEYQAAVAARQAAGDQSLIEPVRRRELLKPCPLKRTVLQPPAFLFQERTRTLKFSHKWVTGFLARAGLRRRAVGSSNNANRPSLEQCNARRAEINAVCEDLQVGPDQIINADETGVQWMMGIRYQYTPSDCPRGSTPGKEEKSRCVCCSGCHPLASRVPVGRFTTMVFGHGDGRLGAPFFIIKCSAKGTDYTRTTVLQTLLKDSPAIDAAFYSRHWTLCTWSRQILMKEKKTGTLVLTRYNIPYLRSAAGAIITVQEKVRDA
jgi:hypothetical protein